MENIKIYPSGWWDSDVDIAHLLVPSICNWIIEFLKNYKTCTLHDFGCGSGHYLQKLSEAGYTNLVGYEGKKTKQPMFSNIIEQDISNIFDIPNKGNVICLEVGEHIPAEFENNFLTNLANACATNHYLILSWAIRGQEFDGHVNCLNNNEVIPKVIAKGFEFLPKETTAVKNAVTDFLHFKSTMVFRKK
jgi:2-polyprenyl-3-methyl-5-hydroxy-6-metoxy-1,4-benzoquinol methylase